jgi:hypothetical protein
MLWYKLLQNTIYCGILHFTSYHLYENTSWCGLVVNKQEVEDKRQKINSLVLCSCQYLADIGRSTSKSLPPLKKKGEGG